LDKVLITGGAGYIGSVLTEKLLKKNYEVTVIDNFLYKQSSLNHLCQYKNLNIIKMDVRNSEEIKKIQNKNDIIIPLAALVGAPICKQDPIGSKTINNDAINIILQNKAKDQIILMPTTNSAYGSGDKNNFCDEESQLNPISNYAIEKVLVEKKLMSLENVVSFRLATVFGMSPRMRIDLLVNDFVLRAVYDKFIVLFESNFKRNYVHISDVADVFLYALENKDKFLNNIFNVGLSDANLSKKELCEKIKKYLKDFVIFEDNFHKDIDQRNYIVSNKKLECTGFKMKKNIDDGILELIKGYRALSYKNYSNI
jgi:nucleoside-diphosphate-sugar epimerase